MPAYRADAKRVLRAVYDIDRLCRRAVRHQPGAANRARIRRSERKQTKRRHLHRQPGRHMVGHQG
ncbi:hypothetical protein PMIN01_11788 [Paraphaeosphaeria minitans]|uniref:Uncharacterized protein n=1 Tax=Paraphaeosphaeria minitans TaxID=565426 RepID=A0A9P6G7H3_9PLEO|nr:hypothetical protein PMIN01_11788 [Paraphaeosphaeria minitans]